LCGIGLTQAGRRSAQGERPSLGVLVFDDGTSLPMTKDYVIGRVPETDSEVSAGDVMLVRLQDPLVSDVHARVRLDGWEVGLIDAGSANGTFVRQTGSDWCVRVPSGGRVVLRQGAIVTVGHRQFRYDSYHRP
jgi:pSer/pThr/pTyr-binding forkhead associated (FHA) protein